jgi:ABC-2 type transport system permease protein
MTAVGTFDHVAPGIMVFAILLLISYTATSLGREMEQGTLHRFRLARAPWLGIMAGVSVAQLLLASVAFALMLLGAAAMGFHSAGSYLDAYLVVLVTAVSAIGVGMLLAALVKGREEAANLSLLAALPLGFLSGAFFDVPGVALPNGGDLYDLLPTTHAVIALRAILNDGVELDALGPRFAALGALSGLYFLVGAGLFWLRRLRRPVSGPA